ncbi:MAG: MoaD/ThiS family protein [Candidatus Rokubacteria bacterium]|nr:MoaD/ThiS family protein [Candidatus Rokubacteria bacterium]
MKIEVRLFATLAAYLPDEGDGRSAVLELAEGSTATDAVRFLQIPTEIPMMMLINGRDAASEQPLTDGDVLSLFPPLAGGQ